MGFEEVGGLASHEPQLSVWILMANLLAGTLALPLRQQFLHSSPAEGNLTYLSQNVSLALNCTNRAPLVEVNAPKLLAVKVVEIPMKFV